MAKRTRVSNEVKPPRKVTTLGGPSGSVLHATAGSGESDNATRPVIKTGWVPGKPVFLDAQLATSRMSLPADSAADPDQDGSKLSNGTRRKDSTLVDDDTASGGALSPVSATGVPLGWDFKLPRDFGKSYDLHAVVRDADASVRAFVEESGLASLAHLAIGTSDGPESLDIGTHEDFAALDRVDASDGSTLADKMQSLLDKTRYGWGEDNDGKDDTRGPINGPWEGDTSGGNDDQGYGEDPEPGGDPSGPGRIWPFDEVATECWFPNSGLGNFLNCISHFDEWLDTAFTADSVIKAVEKGTIHVVQAPIGSLGSSNKDSNTIVMSLVIEVIVLIPVVARCNRPDCCCKYPRGCKKYVLPFLKVEGTGQVPFGAIAEALKSASGATLKNDLQMKMDKLRTEAFNWFAGQFSKFGCRRSGCGGCWSDMLAKQWDEEIGPFEVRPGPNGTVTVGRGGAEIGDGCTERASQEAAQRSWLAPDPFYEQVMLHAPVAMDQESLQKRYKEISGKEKKSRDEYLIRRLNNLVTSQWVFYGIPMPETAELLQGSDIPNVECELPRQFGSAEMLGAEADFAVLQSEGGLREYCGCFPPPSAAKKGKAGQKGGASKSPPQSGPSGLASASPANVSYLGSTLASGRSSGPKQGGGSKSKKSNQGGNQPEEETIDGFLVYDLKVHMKEDITSWKGDCCVAAYAGARVSMSIATFVDPDVLTPERCMELRHIALELAKRYCVLSEVVQNLLSDPDPEVRRKWEEKFKGVEPLQPLQYIHDRIADARKHGLTFSQVDYKYCQKASMGLINYDYEIEGIVGIDEGPVVARLWLEAPENGLASLICPLALDESEFEKWLAMVRDVIAPVTSVNPSPPSPNPTDPPLPPFDSATVPLLGGIRIRSSFKKGHEDPVVQFRLYWYEGAAVGGKTVDAFGVCDKDLFLRNLNPIAGPVRRSDLGLEGSALLSQLSDVLLQLVPTLELYKGVSDPVSGLLRNRFSNESSAGRVAEMRAFRKASLHGQEEPQASFVGFSGLRWPLKLRLEYRVCEGKPKEVLTSWPEGGGQRSGSRWECDDKIAQSAQNWVKDPEPGHEPLRVRIPADYMFTECNEIEIHPWSGVAQNQKSCDSLAGEACCPVPSRTFLSLQRDEWAKGGELKDAATLTKEYLALLRAYVKDGNTELLEEIGDGMLEAKARFEVQLHFGDRGRLPGRRWIPSFRQRGWIGIADWENWGKWPCRMDFSMVSRTVLIRSLEGLRSSESPIILDPKLSKPEQCIAIPTASGRVSERRFGLLSPVEVRQNVFGVFCLDEDPDMRGNWSIGVEAVCNPRYGSSGEPKASVYSKPWEVIINLLPSESHKTGFGLLENVTGEFGPWIRSYGGLFDFNGEFGEFEEESERTQLLQLCIATPHRHFSSSGRKQTIPSRDPSLGRFRITGPTYPFWNVAHRCNEKKSWLADPWSKTILGELAKGANAVEFDVVWHEGKLYVSHDPPGPTLGTPPKFIPDGKLCKVVPNIFSPLAKLFWSLVPGPTPSICIDVDQVTWYAGTLTLEEYLKKLVSIANSHPELAMVIIDYKGSGELTEKQESFSPAAGKMILDALKKAGFPGKAGKEIAVIFSIAEAANYKVFDFDELRSAQSWCVPEFSQWNDPELCEGAFERLRMTQASYEDGMNPGAGTLYPNAHSTIIPHVQKAVCMRDRGGRMKWVGSWTYNDQNDMRKIMDLGVSFLVTDTPDVCKNELAKPEVARKFHLASRGERPSACYPELECTPK